MLDLHRTRNCPRFHRRPNHHVSFPNPGLHLSSLLLISTDGSKQHAPSALAAIKLLLPQYITSRIKPILNIRVRWPLTSNEAMYPVDFDEPQFLEPAHSHDPIHVSNIITLPTSLVKNIPASFQHALTNLQESTSVAFASYSRLQELVAARFYRLVPAKTQPASKAEDPHSIKCKFCGHVLARTMCIAEAQHRHCFSVRLNQEASPFDCND